MDEPKKAFTDFKWLHLSDLHVGLHSQNWLWPTLKHALYQDLQTVHSRTGDWNAVIFSGDLTQKGAKEEFDKLDEIFQDLWEQFSHLGFSPELFVIPGNHDISRLEELSPELRVLKRWWDEPEIHDAFFSNQSSPYRAAANELLSGYRKWQRRFVKSSVKLIRGTTGLLPGDEAAVVELDGL
jgi:DNA repair exonuclease SbcCD nuclease subunit